MPAAAAAATAGPVIHKSRLDFSGRGATT